VPVHTMIANVGVEVLLHFFLTPALEGGEWVTSLYLQEETFLSPHSKHGFWTFQS